jgi:dolichol-phosphate mannosyltransferase
VGPADLVRRFPWARFVKFGVVGVSGIAVNYGVYLPLTRWLGVSAEIALAVSIAVSIVTNFGLNEVWTFRDRRAGGFSGLFRRLVQFLVVSLGGAAIQWSVTMIAFRWLGIHDLVAVLAGIAVATFWNFFLNLVWTWRKPPAPAAGPPPR